MNYVRKLGFEESPDYDFLRELFSKILKTLGEQEDGVYDWMLLNNGKGWEAGNVSIVLLGPGCLGFLIVRRLRALLRTLSKLMLTQALRRRPTANTDLQETIGVHDNRCRKALAIKLLSSVLPLRTSSLLAGDQAHEIRTARAGRTKTPACNQWRLQSVLASNQQRPASVREPTTSQQCRIHTPRRRALLRTVRVQGHMAAHRPSWGQVLDHR